MKISQNFIVGVLLFASCLFFSVSSTHAASACIPMDLTHSKWTEILSEHVYAGQVDYRAIASDRLVFDAYLDSLASACAEDYAQAGEQDKIAFWLNAYNAFTIELILSHYPIASIRNIGWLPGAAFRERFIPMKNLKGRTVSLNDIEHDTLRSLFDEPRIHFALVCAAKSCPSLRNEAYRGADLNLQLDDQARSFLHDKAKNRYLSSTNVLEISAIFDWFHADFEASAGSIAAFVARYLEISPGTAPVVQYQTYDWRLNDRMSPDTTPTESDEIDDD